jgi:carbamoyltransferase
MRPAYYANLDEYHLQRRQQAFETVFDAQTLAAMHEEYEAARVSLGEVERELPGTRYIDHHMAHAASAFYPSGFDNALILVVDGGSESTSTSVFLGDAEGIRAIEHLPLGSSLGVLYG